MRRPERCPGPWSFPPVAAGAHERANRWGTEAFCRGAGAAVREHAAGVVPGRGMARDPGPDGVVLAVHRGATAAAVELPAGPLPHAGVHLVGAPLRAWRGAGF